MKKIIKNLEVENDFAHLYFYTKLYTKKYPNYKDNFEKILYILDKWISYYVEDNNLLKVTEDEVNEILEYRDSIPFDAYNELYFEEVVNFIDIIIYYASCPINEEYDDDKIIIKGKR